MDVCGLVPKVRLVADRLQVSPAGVDAETASVAVPVPVALTVIVEVPEPLGKIWLGDTALAVVAVIVNPVTKVNVAVALWDSVPLVPVIVTVNGPAVDELQVRVAVPELVMLLGVIAPHVRPACTVSVKATFPVKPFTAVIVIVDVRDALVAPEGEVALIVKSVTVNVIAAVV